MTPDKKPSAEDYDRWAEEAAWEAEQEQREQWEYEDALAYWQQDQEQ